MSYSIEQIASQSINSLTRIAAVLNIPVSNLGVAGVNDIAGSIGSSQTAGAENSGTQNEYQLRYMILETLKLKDALSLTSKVIVANEYWNQFRDQPFQVIIEEAKSRGLCRK